MEKRDNAYKCDLCNYITYRKYCVDRHLMSKQCNENQENCDTNWAKIRPKLDQKMCKIFKSMEHGYCGKIICRREKL